MRDSLVSKPRHARFHSAQRLCALVMPLILAACSSVPPRTLPSAPAQRTAPQAKSTGGQALPFLPAAGSGRGGYYKDDGPGDLAPEGLYQVPDAEPKIEPYSKAASRPYVIFGKTYTPITDELPFKQRGIGSWYGKKFHGQKTSSGEPYDMYKMTAAHPTLPIPSYARITNLKTGAQVIVRINDRGPFHSSRIVDLSFTAALKLGYLSSGSSELELERLLPDEILRLAEERRNGLPSLAVAAAPAAQPVTVGAVTPPSQLAAVALAARGEANGDAARAVEPPGAAGVYLQFGAFSQQANARAAGDTLAKSLNGAVGKLETVVVDGLYRLYAGPYATRPAAQDAAQLIRQRSKLTPFIVER